MFIVIEGLDGVGKTTAAKLLAAKLHGEFFPWLHAPYGKALPHIWNSGVVTEASKHIAFLAAFRHMSDIADLRARSNTILVTDRYYFGSLAMHGPLAGLAGEKPLEFDRGALGFKNPDFAFYLALGERARRQRLAARGNELSPVEKLLDKNPDLCAEISRNYEDLVAREVMTKITIDGLSPEETVDIIAAKIRDQCATKTI